MTAKNQHLAKLPQGIYDNLPEELYEIESIVNKIEKEAYLAGFNKVETPILECFDNFVGGNNYVPQKRMFKLSDTDGSLLVLRPDCTLPLLRVACLKLKEQHHKKLYYTGKVFDLSTNSSRGREYLQSGVEYIGFGGVLVDIEVISLAIKNLLSVGIDDFVIEIGHVGYFNGLMKQYDIASCHLEMLRSLINSKNHIEAEFVLEEYSPKAKEVVRSLTTLFGKKEVLAKAKSLCFNDESLAAIENLSQIYDGLCNLGYEKYISIDLGLLQNIDYYSGIVFKGISRFFGAEILAGGRYDGANAELFENFSAVGYAVNISRVVSTLKKQGVVSEMPKVDIAINTLKITKDLKSKIESFKNDGNIVDLCYFSDKNEFIKYCKERSVKTSFTYENDALTKCL